MGSVTAGLFMIIGAGGTFKVEVVDWASSCIVGWGAKWEFATEGLGL